MKPIYHIRKDSNKRQMSQMNIPIKKRKLFCRSLVSNSDRFNGEDYYESREKGVGHVSDSHSKLQGWFISSYNSLIALNTVCVWDMLLFSFHISDLLS